MRVSYLSYRSIPLQAFLDAHNTAAADAAITEVFRISSDCLQARQMSAEMFVLEGKVEEAVAETGRILKMDPGNVPALLLRAQGYFLLQVRGCSVHSLCMGRCDCFTGNRGMGVRTDCGGIIGSRTCCL